MFSRRTTVPKASRGLQWWFCRYLEHYFARHFDGVRVAREGFRPGDVSDPFVVYSNHPSWWDPVLFMLLRDALLPNRDGFGPMDAEALAKYPLFKRLGVFGIERGTHSGAVAFLRTAEAVLLRPRSTLWLTAEGAFTDPRRRPIELQFGLAHLVRRVPNLQVVPLAIEYTFWNERLPEALVRFGQPVDLSGLQGANVEAISGRLEWALEETMDLLAVDAQSREAERFEAILLGKTGIGGPYDLWRRWWAGIRGVSLQLSHEERRR